jgi:hypothetical protein
LLRSRYAPQYAVQRPDAQCGVIGNRNTMMGRRFRLKNDMTSNLMNLPIVPSSNESLRELPAV